MRGSGRTGGGGTDTSHLSLYGCHTPGPDLNHSGIVEHAATKILI